MAPKGLRSDLMRRQFLRCVRLLSFCTGLLRGEGSIDGQKQF